MKTLKKHMPSLRLNTLLIISFLASSVCFSAVEGRNPIDDLVYANALYYFYLKEPLASLTQLEIKYLQDRATNSSVNIEGADNKALNQLRLEDELLEAALKLDYDMELSATAILEKIRQLEPDIKHADQLWLYLANVFYERYLFDISAQTIDYIRNPASLRDYSLWLYLKSQLSLKKADVSMARSFAGKLDKDSIYRIYSLFNIAVYEYHQGEFDNALSTVNHLINDVDVSESEERRMLKDRLLVSAAYMQLYDGDAERALDYFNDISINSSFLDEALLGFGNTAFIQGNDLLAIAAWERLESYSLQPHRKIQALLSLAALYEQREYFTAALTNYDQVDKLCDARKDELLALEKAYDADALWSVIANALAERVDRLDESVELTLSNNAYLFQALLRNNAFLIDVIYEDYFLQQVKNLYELDEMAALLDTWLADIPLYLSIVEDKNRAYGIKAKDAALKRTHLSLDDALRQYDEYKSTLQTIRQEKDVYAVLSADDVFQRETISNAEETLNMMPKDDAFYDEYEENLRRVKGVFTWNAYAHYYEHVWQSESQLLQLEKNLMSYQQLSSSLDEVLIENAKNAVFLQRIDDSAQALSSARVAVKQLSDKAKIALKFSFDEAVATQSQHILHFQRQARLSIARVSETFLDEDTDGGITDE